MILYLPDILSKSDHTHVTGIEGKTGEMCCNLPLHFYPCPPPSPGPPAPSWSPREAAVRRGKQEKAQRLDQETSALQPNTLTSLR